ncbi:helix-turn-helix domain-containing protein [Caldalkalibacillus mannanilyticus]|uniref:helix-turn-helix domain-containing protein n=1 Tax=Caldalkalibacillus mannanilyticus TaxID=1418 RepID=UPI00054D29B9|nr:helix-turn-helix domain-containing protein [Caldalkalibacillus mannanilyticus]
MNAAFLADGEPIDTCHLQLDEHNLNQIAQPSTCSSLEEMEKETILQTLQLAEGNMSKAAKMLRIGRNTLYRKMKRYQL